MRVEQEQRVTEDARRYAEQEAAAQRYAAQVLQVLFSSIIFTIFGLLYNVLSRELTKCACHGTSSHFWYWYWCIMQNANLTKQACVYKLTNLFIFFSKYYFG